MTILLRSLWNWSLFVLGAVATCAVLFAGPLNALLGSPAEAREAWIRVLGSAWVAVTGLGAIASWALASKGKETRPLERFSTVLSLLLLLGVFGLLSRAMLAFAPRGNETAFASFLDDAFGPALEVIADATDRAGLPADLAGVPTAPLALLIAMLLARNVVTWRIDKLKRGEYSEVASLPQESRIQHETFEDARERAAAIERRLAVASYAEAKTLLQATQVELTFVSLDIVGSTVLKQGEDPYVVEQSFGDYRKLVERALRHYGAYKQVWTPDGQMAAFRSPQAGVDCAKEVLQQLPSFNLERSRLRRPFRIRAGANIGTLSTDDRTPMEQISDFSIDVAGHMQKYADPDTLWISEELYRRLEDPAGFEGTGKEVDGRKVFAWKKEE